MLIMKRQHFRKSRFREGFNEQRKRINRLNTLRVPLIQKVKSVKTVNIDEIIIT